MTYVGHTVGGALAACLAIKTASPVQGALVGMVAAALLGGLAPDLDHHASFLSRRLWFVRAAMGLLLSNPLTWFLAGGGDNLGKKRQWRLWRGRAKVRRMLGHRQITHTLVGLAAGTAFWAVAAWGLWLLAARHTPALAAWMGGSGGLRAWVWATTYGWALGWASHILLDAMTISGVPLFLPFSSQRVWALPPVLRVRSKA